MPCPSGPVRRCRGAVGSFWHHRDDRKAGRAGPPAERHRAGRLDDEAVEVGRRAVAGEQDRSAGAAGTAEPTKHVERCAAVPLRCVAQVALAVAGRLEVRAQDADCVEGAGHPQFDVAASAGVDLARHGDVAAVAGDVAFGRVAGEARRFVVADAVVEHVARVRRGAGRHRGILDDRAETCHRSVVVDRGQPGGGRRDVCRRGARSGDVGRDEAGGHEAKRHSQGRKSVSERLVVHSRESDQRGRHLRDLGPPDDAGSNKRQSLENLFTSRDKPRDER